MAGFFGNLLNRAKTLGSAALNGIRTLGSQVATIADSATPLLDKVGLGGASRAVAAGARAVGGVADRIKAVTDRLPSVDHFAGTPMGAASPN